MATQLEHFQFYKSFFKIKRCRLVWTIWKPDKFVSCLLVFMASQKPKINSSGNLMFPIFKCQVFKCILMSGIQMSGICTFTVVLFIFFVNCQKSPPILKQFKWTTIVIVMHRKLLFKNGLTMMLIQAPILILTGLNDSNVLISAFRYFFVFFTESPKGVEKSGHFWRWFSTNFQQPYWTASPQRRSPSRLWISGRTLARVTKNCWRHCKERPVPETVQQLHPGVLLPDGPLWGLLQSVTQV
jgi:hypothetical protein